MNKETLNEKSYQNRAFYKIIIKRNYKRQRPWLFQARFNKGSAVSPVQCIGNVLNGGYSTIRKI